MTTIIITEKTSQKKDLVAAIGTKFGQIFPAEGHLLSLQEPQSVNSTWGKWSFDLLKPDDFYPTCPAPDASSSARSKLTAIEQALKKASRVILATDCDREGQLIGEELLRHYQFSGPVGRAIFTAQDEKTLQEAFDNLEPNENYLNLGQAALVRQQADQVYNLSLTRAATVALKHPGDYGAIGIGRVKTPTMAIVCIRELEIQDFVPQDYYHLVANAKAAAGELQLRYSPKEKILDAEQADLLRRHIEGFEGPLKADKKTKRTKPPKLLDLPELQKICGRKWGWTATKTLDVAQALYDGDGKKIQTYPRAESRYLAENQITDVTTIVQGLKSLEQYQSLDLTEPQIRKGKSGHFSDAGLKGVSHHAIIPNKNTMDQITRIYPRLSDDERKMFDLVASSYLAILMPDYVYESTTVAMDVPGPEEKVLKFKITGNIPKEQGWKSVFNDVMEKKEDHAGELPPVQDGDLARLDPVTVDTKKTKAPSRFNEGSLIDAMQNAWRFVDDKEVQERLKEAKGIGTPATRAAVITGLKKQNFITQSGKNIIPTPAGLTLYKTLKSTAPELVDPGVTALWEMKLDDVLVGKQSARQVWDEIGEATSRLIDVIRDNASKAPKISTGITPPKGTFKSGGKPTDKMMATAKSIADRKGLKLPKKYDTDFQTCKDFLDEHLGGNPLIAIERRLGSGLIKGLGPSAAKTLVESFGTDVFQVIEENPERLSDVKGIGPKIVQAAKDRKSVLEIGRVLQTHGVPAQYGLRLYKIYAEETLQVLSKDPYRIVRDIKWFGFQNADRIAKNIGLSHDDPVRLQAALYHALDQAEGPREKNILLPRLQTHLDVPLINLENALTAELDNKSLHEQLVDGVPHIIKEAGESRHTAITKFLKTLGSGTLPWPKMEIEKAIGWVNKQLSLPLTKDQETAVTTILNAKSLVLNVMAGADILPILNAVHKILRVKDISVTIGSATHSDANIVNEHCECNAEPLAQILGWKSRSGTFKHSAKKPLDCQLLIINNVQKIEAQLLAASLQALPEDAAILLIKQDRTHLAPPISRLLGDLEKLGQLPTHAFNEIQPILRNSQRLNAMNALLSNVKTGSDHTASKDSDFFEITVNSANEMIAKTTEIVANRLPEKFKFDAIEDIQVICPNQKGELGATIVSKHLQGILNPNKEKGMVDNFGHRYHLNDKIMIVVDDFEKGLVRGEMGRIKKIDQDSRTIIVSFTNQKIEFHFDELDILILAYAIPANLAQKIECPATVLLKGTTNIEEQTYASLAAAQQFAVIIG